MTWFDSFEKREQEQRAREYVKRLQREFVQEQAAEYLR
jgi:hypothetical protein